MATSRGYFQQAAQRAGARLGLAGGLVGVGLGHVAPHEGGHDGQQRADHEGDAPAPIHQLLVSQEHVLQQQQHQDRAELAADQRHILEAGIEAAVLGVGDLGQVGGAGAVFPARLSPSITRASASSAGAARPMEA